jgi:UDP-N-acetylmuramoyl-tripeptide--D-alanyl-D-alanine ligase
MPSWIDASTVSMSGVAKGDPTMPSLTAADVAAATGGVVDGCAPEHVFSDFCFDSRQAGPGALFFALASDRADGHQFLGQLDQLQGAGAVVRRATERGGLQLPFIRVDDPAAAYRTLATLVRERYNGVRWIGITGSAGKTTTRALTAQILAHRFRMHTAPGNWNNWLGVPFTMLKMPADTEVAVFELAMSSPGLGEIDALARLLRPDITALLNVFPVHLEFLHTVDNVARGKLEINSYLDSDGVALINGDHDELRRATRYLPGRVVRFGRSLRDNEVVLRDLVVDGERRCVCIDFFGRQRWFEVPMLTAAQLENLFVAILIAWYAGMKHDEIAEAVKSIEPVQGRGVVRQIDGWTVVDDTYNANPEAVKTLLRWCRSTWQTWTAVVLGDMLELGADSQRYHLEVGGVAAALGFERIVAVGERARAIVAGAEAAGAAADMVQWCATPEEAGRWLALHAPADAVLVFKGSRGVHLERAIDQLAQRVESP